MGSTRKRRKAERKMAKPYRDRVEDIGDGDPKDVPVYVIRRPDAFFEKSYLFRLTSDPSARILGSDDYPRE
jgi:hypothetical protein